jgi:hypothetical protein
MSVASAMRIDASSRTGRLLASAVLIGVVAAFSVFIILNPLGARQDSLPKHEVLEVKVSPDATQSHLLIEVTNTGQLPATVMQVDFDNSIVPASTIVPSGGFNVTAQIGFALSSGAKGTLSVASSDIGPLGPEETYTVTVWTAAGNNYSASITWP